MKVEKADSVDGFRPNRVRRLLLVDAALERKHWGALGFRNWRNEEGTLKAVAGVTCNIKKQLSCLTARSHEFDWNLNFVAAHPDDEILEWWTLARAIGGARLHFVFRRRNFTVFARTWQSWIQEATEQRNSAQQALIRWESRKAFWTRLCASSIWRLNCQGNRNPYRHLEPTMLFTHNPSEWISIIASLTRLLKLHAVRQGFGSKKQLLLKSCVAKLTFDTSLEPFTSTSPILAKLKVWRCYRWRKTFSISTIGTGLNSRAQRMVVRPKSGSIPSHPTSGSMASQIRHSYYSDLTDRSL